VERVNAKKLLADEEPDFIDVTNTHTVGGTCEDPGVSRADKLHARKLAHERGARHGENRPACHLPEERRSAPDL